MKKGKKLITLLLMAVLLMSSVHLEAYAASGTGESQNEAIQLTLGKTKKAKMHAGKDMVYYWVGLTERGKLKVKFTAEKIGANVDMKIYSSEDMFWYQTKSFSYSSKKKKASGTLTTDYILPKGGYYIALKADKNMRTAKKIEMSISLVSAGYDDVEPNNIEETAQAMNVKEGTAYSMMVSNVVMMSDVDPIDCFSFKIKEKTTLSLNLTLKQSTEDMMVLLRQKKGDTIETIENFQMSSSKLKKKIKLNKGTYYVKVWYTGGRTVQIPYTISVAADKKVTGVSLNKTKLTLNVDASAGKTTAVLKATVNPKDATNKKLTWKSSNTKVAKVSGTGKVTAVSGGKATITVTATDGSKKSAKCVVTVSVPNLSIDGKNEMTEGDTQTLIANVKSGKWKSSNPEVLSVSSASGKQTTVSANKAGNAIITFSAYGKNVKYNVAVKAKPQPKPQPTPQPKPQPVVAPQISGGTTTHVGSSVTFTVTNGVSGVTWYSSDPSILSGSGSGSSCTMTARRAGTVTVYCVANGQRSNTITVSVRG